MDIPAEPVLFTKGVSCIQRPNDPIVIPRGSTKTDWEVELAVVIRSTASYVSEDDALAHVAVHCDVDDGSDVADQLERSATAEEGTGCPHHTPHHHGRMTATE